MACASGKRSGGRGGSGDGGGGGESGMFSRDVAWKYCSLVEGNLNGIICNFCGLLMKSRDIS